MTGEAVSTGAVPSTDHDLFCDDALTDPYPIYDELRAQGGAVWMTAHNAFVLTRFDECREALRNWAVFSSANGAMMNDPLNEMFSGQILLCTDGVQHGRLRSAIGAPLTTKALADVREQIDTEAERLVERLVAVGEFDAVRDLAYHLPVSIVSTLVGIPEAGRERMVEWGGAVFNLFGPMNGRANEAFPLVGEMSGFIENECQRENLSPGGWGMGLYEAADRGDIAPDDPAKLMTDYMVPSLDTTINATSNMVWLFANNPDQWDLLRERPDLASNAISEILRIESVIQGFSRFTTVDHDVDDVTIPAGSRVFVSYGAANRDPHKFTDPARFDIERSNASDHLGLGYGAHSCPGGHLARMELRALITALLPRVERFEIASVSRKLNNVIRGLGACHVRTIPV
jgi:cytochrome P450